MNRQLIERLDALGHDGKRDLLARFWTYTLDGDNRRAGLTVDEVDLLIAIANDDTAEADT